MTVQISPLVPFRSGLHPSAVSKTGPWSVARLMDWNLERVDITMMSGRKLTLRRDETGGLPLRPVALAK